MSSKVVGKLVLVSRHITEAVLPRLHYLLEPILSDDVEKDHLTSIHESLMKKHLENGRDATFYLVWALKHIANVDNHLSDLLPEPFPEKWMPENPRLVMRLLMVKIDRNEHFARNVALYKKFVCYVVGQYPELGNVDDYNHSDYESRMNLFRHLEEQKIISPSDITKLTDVLESLDLKSLKERIEEDFDVLLKEVSLKKRFDNITSRLPIERVIPRVHYMLEGVLSEDVIKDDLLSMFKSMRRRALDGHDPLTYITWALTHTGNQQLAETYLGDLLPRPYLPEWSPPDHHMVMRMVLVQMDMSEPFRDKAVYKDFIRSISQYDEYIGIPGAYPHDKIEKRMQLYRHLEELKVVSPSNINQLLDSLREIGLQDLLEKVDKQFLSLVFSKPWLTPVAYYAEHQLAHHDKSSPLYSMHRLDVPYAPPNVPTNKTSNSGMISTQSSTSRSTEEPPKYESSVTGYRPPFTQPGAAQLFMQMKPSLEERIWITGESGEDVVKLCIERIQASTTFPSDMDNQFMRRIAYTMSRDGNPPFYLLTDGGIWQVSLHGFMDSLNTRAHVRLTTKYEKIARAFNIQWLSVERRELAKPMYSALAARLYLSNYAEPFPPYYEVEKQADYWWDKYLHKHESKPYMKKSDFTDCAHELYIQEQQRYYTHR